MQLTYFLHKRARQGGMRLPNRPHRRQFRRPREPQPGEERGRGAELAVCGRGDIARGDRDRYRLVHFDPTKSLRPSLERNPVRGVAVRLVVL